MTTPTALDITLQRLVDQDQLQRLVHQVGRCLDDGDFDGLRDIYTDDAMAHTPGGRVVGIDALVEQARRAHTRTPAVQHHITDILIDIDDNHAEMRATLLVTFADGPRATATRLPARRGLPVHSPPRQRRLEARQCREHTSVGQR